MKNINKIYSGLAILLAAVIMLSACEERLDINQDPLAASEEQFSQNPELLFTRIQVELAAERVLESGNVFLFFSQMVTSAGSAGAVFTDPEQYVVPDFPSIVSWGTYYINLLKNIEIGAQLAEEGGVPNIAGVYNIMKAFVFYHITVSWEDAPFRQAVDFQTDNPVFDSQETILRGIDSILVEAVNQIDVNDPTGFTGGQDFIYDNDMESWVRFANSLRLKVNFLLVNKDPSVSSTIANLINNEPLVDEPQYNALHPFGTDITNANQLWKLHNQFAGGTSAFFNATTTILEDLMTPLNDPRISTYFDEGSGADPGEFNGGVPGATDNFTDLADLSLNLLRPTEPDKWMTASEINLLKAEAAARGFTGGNAGNLLRLGVQQSLDFYDGRPGEISSADKTAYVNSLPTLPDVEDIQEQQYIDLFLRGVEAWTNIRRTGVPDLPVPNGAALNTLIRRLPWAPDAAAVNPETPPQPPLDQPMWFEPN